MRVSLNSDWRRYASELAGFTMLGVVHGDNGEVGALAQTAFGVYVQVNGALIRDLDQEMVRVEIAIARRQQNQAP